MIKYAEMFGSKTSASKHRGACGDSLLSLNNITSTSILRVLVRIMFCKSQGKTALLRFILWHLGVVFGNMCCLMLAANVINIEKRLMSPDYAITQLFSVKLVLISQ